MKKASSVLLRLCCAFGLHPFSPVAAETLEWDTDTITTGAQGATITTGWASGPYWWNGANNVTWTNGSDAVFGGTSGTVSDAGVNVDDITFSVPGYVLQPGDIDFGLKLGGGEGPHVITVAGNTTINHRLLGTEGLTKAGPGVLSIGNANHTLTGTLTIDAGEVKIAGGFIDPELSLVLADRPGAKLTIDQQAQVLGGLSGGGVSGGELRLNGSLTLGGDNSSSTYDGVISGNGGLTKTGTGTLTLNNSHSSYTAPTFIYEGIVSTPNIADNGILSALGIGGLIRIGNGATLRQSGPIADSTDRRLELVGSGNLEVASADAVLTWNGRISGDSFQKGGLGTLEMTDANTFTGDTTISGGTLRIKSGNCLSDFGALTIASGAVLDLAGSNEVVGKLSGSGDINLGTGSLRTYVSSSGSQYTGIISGTGTFEKAGPGGLVLSGANTFTGSLGVSEGFLSIGSNNIASLSSITLGDSTHSGGILFSSNNDLRLSLTAPITIRAGGGSLYGKLDLRGPIEGNAELYLREAKISGDKAFAGTIHFDSSYSGISAGIAGNLPNASIRVDNGNFSISGQVADFEFRGGQLVLGGSSFTTQNLLLSTTSGIGSTYDALYVAIQDSVSYGNIQANGKVTLDSIGLSVGLGRYDPQDNVDIFRLIVNDGSDPTELINGKGFFLGAQLLQEGAKFTVAFLIEDGFPPKFGYQEFQIRYGLDSTDNDVRLIAIPEPSVPAALFSTAALFYRRRRQSTGK